MTKLLLFDFNNLLYKSVYSFLPLKYRNIYTGGVFGFIIQMAKQVNSHLPDSIVVCDDFPPYLRNTEFFQYKGNRVREVDEEMQKAIWDSRKLCAEFIGDLGVPHWKVKGYEADDLIAFLVQNNGRVLEKVRYNCKQWKKYKEYAVYDKIVIVSNDNDLFQLLGDGRVCLQRGEKTYSLKDFQKDYPNINLPDDWIKIIAMSGGHNGVPGVAGIGIKTAVKMLTDFRYASKYDDIKNKCAHILELYERLVKLPYEKKEGSLHVYKRLDELDKIRYNELGAIGFCAKYGIKVNPAMREMFSYLGTLRKEN